MYLCLTRLLATFTRFYLVSTRLLLFLLFFHSISLYFWAEVAMPMHRLPSLFSFFRWPCTPPSGSLDKSLFFSFLFNESPRFPRLYT
ncbi:hypothetical protein B0H16DRAFT_1585477 [Mycena metata]|uniref:Uncharacterized protein n=1 Tax=Mycena metata TaxID=1033252 RepID=A0AAD7HYD0_9AGAR|nr:hypothetical protein B0H16DRAFT_1585477 [Mycena metata]